MQSAKIDLHEMESFWSFIILDSNAQFWTLKITRCIHDKWLIVVMFSKYFQQNNKAKNWLLIEMPFL